MRKFLLILLGFSVLSGSAFDRTKYSLRNEVIVQSKQNESSYTTVAYPGLLKMSDNDNFVFKIYDIDGVGVAPTNCVIVSNPVGGISPLVKRLDMGQVICGIDSLQMGNDKFYYLSFDNPEPDSYLKLIKESGLCKSVDFNYYYLDSFQGAVSPGDDVYYNRQWYLRDVYGINPQTAWNSYDGEGVRVAILDSGIDNTHPDLAQNLIGGIDFSVDANPNGQYNSQAKEREHGTCVAGLIGAVDNSIGIVGVAPKCEMIPIKITDAGAKVSSKSAIEALKYAVFTQKADVISFSLKIPLDDASIFVALDNAYSQGRENKGCVLVASSGNNAFESIAFPANYKNVIAVGSLECGRR